MRIAASITLGVVVGFGLAGATAHAQTFPGDAGWTSLPCGDLRMFDPVDDEPMFADGLDLVGDQDQPAGMRAVDADFLYLRMRLDATPVLANGDLAAASAWGFAFDLDGDRTDYEVLVLASGVTQTVELFTNQTTTIRNRLADPADAPPVATYPFADNGRTIDAILSDFDANPDRFLDVAIPWTDLDPLGLRRLTPISVWAGSSMLTNGLDGDIACHDGVGGDAAMDVVVTGRTVADPDTDTDGDGFADADEVEAGSDPADMNDVPDTGGGGGDGGGTPDGVGRIEGGGGCSIATRDGTGIALTLVLAFAAAVVAGGAGRRRRR